jgi:SAM-dependent methyltransferase
VTDDDQDWNDPARVDRWVARDAQRHVLRTARELSVALVGLDTRPASVVELAGGAGTFLAEFLDAYPTAHGLWSDSSGEMERHARATLSRFGDRVDFLVADMRNPGVAHASADVVVCARATHGIGSEELGPFYREVAAILRPGGWFVNLDHMAAADPWGARYDQVTARFYDQSEKAAPVRTKNRGSHTVEAHLDALAAAGLIEADTPWRLLSTVLLLARRPSSPRQ